MRWLARGACIAGLLAIAASASSAAPHRWDLDGDGQPDSNLEVGPCTATPPATCLRLVSAKLGTSEFVLTEKPATAIHVEPIGRHFAGPLQAAFVYWRPRAGIEPTLSVFDLNGGGLQAWTSPPAADAATGLKAYTIHDTYFAVIDGPEGKRYPFLAPGRRRLNEPHWESLCIFDRAKIPRHDPGCGTGFKKYGASFPDSARRSGFRHNGGWLEDVDGDGWQDINLPFLRYILVVSGRTGAQLALLHPNFTQSTEPNSRADFDSGRMYGSFTPFVAADGKHSVLIAAANAAGSFDDYNCNVSRFCAVLQTQKPNDAASRTLKWSRYFSFVKDVFDPRRPETSRDTIVRHGNFIDKCVHRVSDSVFHAGRQPISLYNIFTADPALPAETCLQEHIEERRSRYSGDAAAAANACAADRYLAATGNWAVQALELEGGASIAEWRDGYVWGRIRNFLPGRQEVFLLEKTEPRIRFDQRGYTPKEFLIVGIGPDFRWQPYDKLPTSSRPAIAPTTPGLIPFEGTVGATRQGIWEIQTRPGIGKLFDIRMQDGTWLGYDEKIGGIVVKP